MKRENDSFVVIDEKLVHYSFFKVLKKKEVEEEEVLVEEEGRDLKGTAGSLEEDETEVYEVTIRGKKYFTTDQKNGKIYAMDKDGDVGDEIGKFVNGVAKI
jgi:hypothetical protein